MGRGRSLCRAVRAAESGGGHLLISQRFARFARSQEKQPILATGQDKSADLRPPRKEPDEEGGYVRGADYSTGGSR